jgi:hypothetical protein
MPYRRYELREPRETVEVFDGYYLFFGVGNDYTWNDDEPCFIGIGQEYRPPLSDTVRIDSLRNVQINLLCVRFDCVGWSYCPLADSVSINPQYYWSNDALRGPFHSYGHIRIPARCKEVHLSFEAVLVNRETDEELAIKTMRVTLDRNKGLR